MNKGVIVSPSILSGDFANMERTVKNVAEWGGDWVHCDVMDGHYVTNLTFGMPMIAALKKVSELPLDVHLMIDKPEKYAQRFLDAGADVITFHPEASDNPSELLRSLRNSGKRAGIALNPNVKAEDYVELLPDCDIVVVMTVYAGYGGQKMIPECLDKVRYLRKIGKDKGLEFDIEVDGGVTEENANAVIEAGANVIVAGSAVFKSVDPKKTIDMLKGVTK